MDATTRTTRALAVAVAVALVAGGGATWLALGPSGSPLGEAAPTAQTPGHDGMDENYDWLPDRAGDGEVPTLMDALTELERIGFVRLTGNAELPASGVVSGGSGTPEDPYLIEGVYAQSLEIRDTDAWFEIKSSYFDHLYLNWNDQHAWVHHNRIGDLRVNENDPRTGNATGGVIEDNVIGYVGQIRHFDGIFRNNVVGDDELQTPSFDDAFDTFREAINIDGYVNAVFEDNTVHGEVIVDLHGHGHASCRGCHPHNHYTSMNASEKAMEHDNYDPDDYEDLPEFGGHDHPMDHGLRFHTIHIRNNVIDDPDGRGLYIEDQNHDADDRTANSEPDPELEAPHWHDVLIVAEGNTLRGAGIVVDVMVADDMYHVPGGGVEIRLVDNTIEAGVLPVVDLHEVRNATLLVEGNRIAYAEDELHTFGLLDRTFRSFGTAEGLRLDEIANATITIQGNTFADLDRGIAAYAFPSDTTWSVVDNTFVAVQTPVWWDDSVENEPAQDGNDRTSG